MNDRRVERKPCLWNGLHRNEVDIVKRASWVSENELDTVTHSVGVVHKSSQVRTASKPISLVSTDTRQ